MRLINTRAILGQSALAASLTQWAIARSGDASRVSRVEKKWDPHGGWLAALLRK